MKMIAISRKGPNLSNCNSDSPYCGGKIPAKIFDPSNGGMGIRLKKARTRFMISPKTIIWMIIPKRDDPKSGLVGKKFKKRIIKPKPNAANMFAPGPAKETHIISFLGSRK